VKSWAKHPLRVTGRLLWLGGEIILAALSYARWCAFRAAATLPTARAKWLQESSRRVLKIFRTETSVVGTIPQSGLLVCNHLSYLDVLVLAALTPSRFVSKSEVRNWPVFGWFACLAGTIFVDRNKRSQALRSAEEIDDALAGRTVVVLFPEGTSSDGETVLPFKSSLLEPAARTLHHLTAGSISYELADGDVGEEVCYWKDMTLVPHLINLLSKRRVHTLLQFAETPQRTTSRKVLARQLHSEVLRLKTAIFHSLQSIESDETTLPERWFRAEKLFAFGSDPSPQLSAKTSAKVFGKCWVEVG
jgi:1-acyl-sn-glycerol-3-phosphate acyltransferase